MNVLILELIVQRDPEQRQAGSSRVTVFNAMRLKKVKDREFKTYIDVKCWGELADVVSNSIVAGDRVLVQGELDMESWKGKDDKWNSKLVATAKSVLKLSPVVIEREAPAAPVSEFGDMDGNPADIPF